MFRSSIIEAILLKNGINITGSSASTPNKKLKRNNIGVSGIEENYPNRSMNAEHLPVFVAKRGNCKLCYAKNEGMTRTEIEKPTYVRCEHPNCQVYLCCNSNRNCFV